MSKLISTLIAASALAASSASTPATVAKPTIVLVHGAFADALGWQKLIPILLHDGYQVTAVEIPLESLDGDIATTKRALDLQTGPVVLVGHSYGGAVITGAAAGNPKVKALVYLAAIAPDVGETVDAYLDKYPTLLGPALKPDSAGFLTVDPDKFHAVFAADLSAGEAAVAAATQKPINGAAFKGQVHQAAWKTIPSWYAVSKQDHALNPDLERFYADRMHAQTVEIDASHVAFLSHPQEVARLIEQAATAAPK